MTRNKYADTEPLSVLRARRERGKCAICRSVITGRSSNSATCASAECCGRYAYARRLYHDRIGKRKRYQPTPRVYVKAIDQPVKHSPAKPGLPCGMDPIDNYYANLQIRGIAA